MTMAATSVALNLHATCDSICSAIYRSTQGATSSPPSPPPAACNLALACPLSRILSAPQQRFAYNQSEAKLICHFAAVVVAAVAAAGVGAADAAAAAAVPAFNLANGIARLLNY